MIEALSQAGVTAWIDQWQQMSALIISTSEEDRSVFDGEWIVMQNNGKCAVISDEEFKKSYQLICDPEDFPLGKARNPMGDEPCSACE